jgi:hypothetical protein
MVSHGIDMIKVAGKVTSVAIIFFYEKVYVLAKGKAKQAQQHFWSGFPFWLL